MRCTGVACQAFWQLKINRRDPVIADVIRLIHMKRRKPVPDYFDERRGIWTSFKIEPDRIVFERGKPKQHWIVLLLTLIVVGLLTASLLETASGLIALTMFAAIIVWLAFNQRSIDKKRFPLVLTKNAAADKTKFETGTIYESAVIKKFIVRENTGRDNAEDSHLIQIYMALKNSNKLVLLHQDYHTPERIDEIYAIADAYTCWLRPSAG